MMEEHRFTYAINNSSNDNIFICFMGIYNKERINCEELDELAEKVFSAKDYSFIDEIVTFIRTIYKDLEEVELWVRIEDSKNILKEKVVYDKGNITNYYCRSNKAKGKKLAVRFENGDFNIFDSSGKNLNLNNYWANEEIIKFTTEQFKRVYSLSNLTSVTLELNRDIVRLLGVIYNNFFDKEIDFAIRGMPKVINNIISILTSLKVCYIPGNDYYFEYDSILKIPYSIDLILLADNLIPLGKFRDIDEVSFLNYYGEDNILEELDILKIKYIGEIVREESNNLDLSINEILKYLASCCYVRNMTGNLDDEYLRNLSCVPLEYFEIFRGLICRIDKVIEKKDVYSYKLQK